jgi:polysaccharide biosynthesis/export protein
MRLLLSALFAFAVYAQQPALQSRPQDYRLQPGDGIEVQYRYTPEFNAKATVQPDGAVSLPIAGPVRVAGLTLAETRAAIASKAAERLRDPELAVILTDFLKPSFTVSGEVAKPGKYDLRGPVSIVEAVAIGGGLKPSSKHSQLLLVRRKDDTYADVRLIDLKRLMTAGGIGENVWLQDGDLLIIPQNLISKIERFVTWGALNAGAIQWRR